MQPALMPKLLIERGLSLRGRLAKRDRLEAELAAKPFEDPKRVDPEPVDFDRFAVTRCYHPVADLGIHPRQLDALLALAQKPVLGIDVDSETRTHLMGRYKFAQ